MTHSLAACTLCTCDTRDNIACILCKSISNVDIENTKIVIKPGDIIKYKDHFDVKKICYGTISSLKPIENEPTLARIHIMYDRSLTVNESICLVYSFNPKGSTVDNAILKFLPNLQYS